MTSLAERGPIMGLVSEAIGAGARQDRACAAIGLSQRTLPRWPRDQSRGDQRPVRLQAPKNKLDPLERERLLAVANSAEFGPLPPSQIVPRLADRGPYLASESTFYRVLRAENQCQHRGAERPAQKRHKPRALCATAPISCSVGTLRIYPRRSRAAPSTCICSWIFLAERSSAGRSMKTKAVSRRAKSCVIFAHGKTSRRTQSCGTPITAVR